MVSTICSAILRDKQTDYFDSNIDSQYMSFALPIKTNTQSKIPAVCHVDGTTRLQSVSKERNPFLSTYFKFSKNLPSSNSINTSFNESEPIVETPIDAIKTFKNRY